MPEMHVTRTGRFGAVFIRGLPPADTTEKQQRALEQLASIYAARNPDAILYWPKGTSQPGGWNLVTPSAEFEKFLSITTAILANQFETLAHYRDEED